MKFCTVFRPLSDFPRTQACLPDLKDLIAEKNEPRVVVEFVMDKTFICYMNLGGKCAYGSSCKYEHTNMLYAWKILRLDKEISECPKSSIANRTLSNRDCESVEKAYCDPFYEDEKTLFKIR